MTYSAPVSDERAARLNKALARSGTHTWDDMCDLLNDGKCQLFSNERGVAVTEIIQTPRRRLFRWWLAAGELESVMDLQPTLTTFAEKHGCELMVAAGRPGCRPR